MKHARLMPMSAYPTLERYRKEICRCVRCGACKAVCPAFMQEMDESHSARGRMALVKAVLDGRLRVSDIYKDRLATCFGCLACEESCPSGVPVTEIIQAAKEQAAAESGLGIINAVISGILKNDIAIRSLAWLAPVVLHYGRKPGFVEGRGSWVKGRGRRVSSKFKVQSSKEIESGRALKDKNRGKVAFFAGCAINYFQHDIARAAFSVLERLGYDVVVPEDQKCCGRPMLSLGDRKAAEELAAHNASLLIGLSVDAVVTACASCGLTFKKEYPKLLAPDKGMPPVFDIHEIISDSISELAFTPQDKRITIHDPCHLGRGQGLSGTIRKILRSIPGLTLVEMKNADRCCGFGGMMRITHRELSAGMAGNKAKDIISTGASLVATGCPGCRMQISDALGHAGSNIEAVHTVQIVERALVHVEQADPAPLFVIIKSGAGR